jgi:hypothetical protein
MAWAQALSAMCQDDPSRALVTGAWVHSANTHYSVNESGITFAERTGDWSYNYDAFQIGCGIPLVVSDESRFGQVVVGGTIALPSSAEGEELFTNGGSTPFTLHSRKWKADT